MPKYLAYPTTLPMPFLPPLQKPISLLLFHLDPLLLVPRNALLNMTCGLGTCNIGHRAVLGSTPLPEMRSVPHPCHLRRRSRAKNRPPWRHCSAIFERWHHSSNPPPPWNQRRSLRVGTRQAWTPVAIPPWCTAPTGIEGMRVARSGFECESWRSDERVW